MLGVDNDPIVTRPRHNFGGKPVSEGDPKTDLLSSRIDRVGEWIDVEFHGMTP